MKIIDSIVLAFILVVLFFLNPFAAFVLAFFLMLSGGTISSKTYIYIVLIAAFWGLLNFTQKSSGLSETDIMRYYPRMEFVEKENFSNIFNFINPLELMSFTFYPASYLVVAISGRVETMGFFWTFLVYLLTYLSILRLFLFYDCKSQRKYAIITFVTSFCFILFVEIGDIMKQSAAFALFFYSLTLYFTKGKTWMVVLFVILAIGCQLSVVILFLLYFSFVIKTKNLIRIFFILLPVLIFSNIFSTIFAFLPDLDVFMAIEERYSGYIESGKQVTVLYVVIAVTLLMYALLSWKKKISNKMRIDVPTNMALLYLIILFSNYENFAVFKRFSLLAYFPFTLITVTNYINNWNSNIRSITRLFCVVMMLVICRYTNGRLNGNYSSTYMDNSIIEIVFSPMHEYLNRHYR